MLIARELVEKGYESCILLVSFQDTVCLRDRQSNAFEYFQNDLLLMVLAGTVRSSEVNFLIHFLKL